MDGWLNAEAGTWQNAEGIEFPLQRGLLEDSLECPLCKENHMVGQINRIAGHDVTSCTRGHRFAELPTKS